MELFECGENREMMKFIFEYQVSKFDGVVDLSKNQEFLLALTILKQYLRKFISGNLKQQNGKIKLRPHFITNRSEKLNSIAYR